MLIETKEGVSNVEEIASLEESMHYGLGIQI